MRDFGSPAWLPARMRGFRLQPEGCGCRSIQSRDASRILPPEGGSHKPECVTSGPLRGFRPGCVASGFSRKDVAVARSKAETPHASFRLKAEATNLNA